MTGVRCTNAGCAWHDVRTKEKHDSGCHKYGVKEMVGWIGEPAIQACSNFSWDHERRRRQDEGKGMT